MSKHAFEKMLNDYLATYQYVGKPTLWMLDNPSAFAEPELPEVKALGSLWSADGSKWDKDRLTQFMNLWTPTIVLGKVSASPSNIRISLDGAEKSMPAYNLFGNNYVRLRDVSELLTGTSKQFDVSWLPNENCVALISNQAYSGETMPPIGNAIAQAVYSNQTIKRDGADCALTAYSIAGNNYVRLRDLGTQMGFEIQYNVATNTILINT